MTIGLKAYVYMYIYTYIYCVKNLWFRHRLDFLVGFLGGRFDRGFDRGFDGGFDGGLGGFNFLHRSPGLLHRSLVFLVGFDCG